MKAMILAAGRGERMRPLTDHTPKPMLAIHGKPIVVHLIEALARAGVRDLIINHAHLGAQIEAGLGTGARYGVAIRYSPEVRALETAGGIANALPLLGNAPFIVANGDVYSEFDFGTLATRRLAGPTGRDLAHLVLVPNPPHHPDGDFALADSRVHDATEPAPRHTFSGIALYHPFLFADLKRGEPARLAPLLRNAMASHQVAGELFRGAWHDVGTPQRLAELNAGR